MRSRRARWPSRSWVPTASCRSGRTRPSRRSSPAGWLRSPLASGHGHAQLTAALRAAGRRPAGRDRAAARRLARNAAVGAGDHGLPGRHRGAHRRGRAADAAGGPGRARAPAGATRSLRRPLRHANPYALALGAGVLIVTLVAARISSRIPGALIGLAGAGSRWLSSISRRAASACSARSSVHAAACRLPALADMRLRPHGAAGAGGRHGLHHADGGGGEHLPVRRRQARQCQPRFGAVGAGSVLAGLIGSFPVDASPPSRPRSSGVRRALADRLAHRGRPGDRSVAAGGGL